jgi:hypothetical protein
MTKWVLSLSEMDKDKLGQLSLIHVNQGARLYAEDGSPVTKTSFGFYILSGYILPRFEEKLNYSNTQDLIEQLWALYGTDWKHHVKGFYNLVAFFDSQWWVLNDTLGLSKVYWSQGTGQVSNSFDCLTNLAPELIWNPSALLSREYFHRDIGEITIVKSIKKSRTGIQITCKDAQLEQEYYFNCDALRHQPIHIATVPEDFIGLWESVINGMEKVVPNANHIITITGGKDARTGLALLKYFKRQVVGLTYGVSNSKDATFARRLAVKANIEHVIPALPNSSEAWTSEVASCIEVDSSYISPHRALRNHALKSAIGNELAWYWGGYMGGEWLMGLYPDGLVFPKWLTELELGKSIGEVVFYNHVELSEYQELEAEVERIQEQVNKAKSLKELEFIWMFEIGVLHHAQDLNLAFHAGAHPYPFMMDIDFIEKLFQTRYSFFFQDHASKNLLKRWKLYEWNIRIQQKLMPDWGNIPFGKKGEYTPNVYLMGSVFWAIYKAGHYIFEKKNYPSSFSYTEEWRAMYLDFFHRMEKRDIPFYSNAEIQNLKKQLEEEPLPKVEKSWMAFSRLVMVYLQSNKILRLRNAAQDSHPEK